MTTAPCLLLAGRSQAVLAGLRPSHRKCRGVVWLRHREWDRPRYRHSVLLQVRPETREVLLQSDLRPAGLDTVYSVVSVGGDWQKDAPA